MEEIRILNIRSKGIDLDLVGQPDLLSSRLGYDWSYDHTKDILIVFIDHMVTEEVLNFLGEFGEVDLDAN